MIRVLTVRQPWASAMFYPTTDPRTGQVVEAKDVENRPRNVAGDYRGPVAIHASLTHDTGTDSMVGEHPIVAFLDWNEHSGVELSTTAGQIIGVVDLVDVHVARATASGRLVDWAEHTKPEELCSPWAEWDRWHLELANPRPLQAPIPFKGALHLQTAPEAVEAEIVRQIGPI
jgi:hypothetical protein